MSLVYDTLIAYLPSNRKHTPSGWMSFNAVCCIHNGETADNKKRGGLRQEDDTVSYHCFNCGYKASWSKGLLLQHRMRKLFEWIGVPDDVIMKIAFELLRDKEGVVTKNRVAVLPKFEIKNLPPDAKPLEEWSGEDNKYIIKLVEYMRSRNLYLEDTSFYWSPNLQYRNRLIIPFFYEKKIVGWTARDVLDGKNFKYISEQQPGYVYGIDQQQDYKRVFSILVEGPIDAIHVDGMALLGSELKDEQALLINSLGKDIIFVPDRDKKGSYMIEPAIDQGWMVSLPEWDSDINDVGAAAERYGRLYTLHSIISAAEYSPLKIRLRKRKWFF